MTKHKTEKPISTKTARPGRFFCFVLFIKYSSVAQMLDHLSKGSGAESFMVVSGLEGGPLSTEGAVLEGTK
jgi:hypothetical protein